MFAWLCVNETCCIEDTEVEQRYIRTSPFTISRNSVVCSSRHQHNNVTIMSFWPLKQKLLFSSHGYISDLLLEGLWRYHVVKWTKDGGTWWGYPEIFMKRWPLLSFFSLLHIFVNLLFTTNACLIQINWISQLTGQCQNIRLTWHCGKIQITVTDLSVQFWFPRGVLVYTD